MVPRDCAQAAFLSLIVSLVVAWPAIARSDVYVPNPGPGAPVPPEEAIVSRPDESFHGETSPPGPAASFDSSTAIAQGRMLYRALRKGDVETLWEALDSTGRQGLGSRDSLSRALASLRSRHGAAGERLADRVAMRRSYFEYRARCRFAGEPDALVVKLVFDPNGKLAAFSVSAPATVNGSAAKPLKAVRAGGVVRAPGS